MTDVTELELRRTIEAAWEERQLLGGDTGGPVRAAVAAALDALDRGAARVAEKRGGEWVVNEWLKKAVLLSFRLNDMSLIDGGPAGACWWDKVPSKFAGMTAEAFRAAGFRAVPGAVVRRSAYIGAGVVLMPSFVNVGAYVDAGTMVDTWATVGSCAQIGRNVHLSGGVGIGGVLEPLQANPTIIEDNCFIGARSEVVDGHLHQRLDQDRRPGDGGRAFRPRAALFGCRPGRAACQTAHRQRARPEPLLCGDRQDGRC
jgi:2,3,4,5-tetrahydropyridine-2-carboxylate N-succinyltransferase